MNSSKTFFVSKQYVEINKSNLTGILLILLIMALILSLSLYDK